MRARSGFIIAFLCLAATIGFFNFVLDPVSYRLFPAILYRRDRIKLILEQLPAALENCRGQKTILALGGSATELAFAPIYLKKPQNACAFNLGTIGGDYVLDALALRLRDDLVQKNLRVDHAFFLVSPIVMTKRAQSFQQGNEENLSQIILPGRIWAGLRPGHSGTEYPLTPIMAVRLLTERYLLGSASSRRLPDLLRALYQPVLYKQYSLFTDFWVPDAARMRDPWPRSRGGYHAPELDTPGAYKKLLTAIQSAKGQTEFGFMMESLHAFSAMDVDDGAVERLVRSVKALRGIANNVWLVYPPTKPGFSLSVAGRQRMQNMFLNVERGSDVKVIQISAQGFTASDYIDNVHFSPAGAEKFSLQLQTILTD